MTVYVLHPGHVISATDGQRHYVDAMTLVRLYGLENRHHEYVFYPFSRTDWFGWREPEGAIHLYPRSDGNYVLPSS